MDFRWIVLLIVVGMPVMGVLSIPVTASVTGKHRQNPLSLKRSSRPPERAAILAATGSAVQQNQQMQHAKGAAQAQETATNAAIKDAQTKDPVNHSVHSRYLRARALFLLGRLRHG